MSTGQFLICLAILVAVDFLGWRISNRLTRGAQERGDVSTVGDEQSQHAVPGRVIAREFWLVDEAGNLRLVMFAKRNGETGLAMYDSAGKMRLRMDVQADGTPGLAMLEAAGKPRLTIHLDEAGRSGLAMWDSAGKVRLNMAVARDSASGLRMYDPQGTERLLVAVLNAGVAGRVAGAAVRLNDLRGKMRLLMGVSDDDTRFLTMADSAEGLRLGMRVDEYDKPLVELFGPRGRSIWRAP